MNRKAIPITVILIFFHVSVFAWSQNCLNNIANDALNLMPENFKLLVQHHEAEFWAGVHQAPNKQEAPAIMSQIKSIVEKTCTNLQSQKGFQSVVRDFGLICKYITSMMHPLHDLTLKSNFRTDYEIYLEKNRVKFWIRWPGVENRPRSLNEIEQLLQKNLTRSLEISRKVSTAFDADKTPIENYDSKSVPFGIGSIAYSMAVSSSSLVWLYIWDQSGGISKSSTK